MELSKKLGIDLTEHPEFWAGYEDLRHQEPKNLSDLLGWLKARYSERMLIERAIRWEQTMMGIAEFWGAFLEEERRDGLAAVVGKCGLTVTDYHALVERGRMVEAP